MASISVNSWSPMRQHSRRSTPYRLQAFASPQGSGFAGVRDEGEPELPGEGLHPFGGVVREDAEDDPLRLSRGNPFGDAGEGGWGYCGW